MAWAVSAAAGTVAIWTAFILISRAGGKSALTGYDILALRLGTASLILLPFCAGITAAHLRDAARRGDFYGKMSFGPYLAVRAIDELPLYQFRYKDEPGTVRPHTGVIAEQSQALDGRDGRKGLTLVAGLPGPVSGARFDAGIARPRTSPTRIASFQLSGDSRMRAGGGAVAVVEAVIGNAIARKDLEDAELAYAGAVNDLKAGEVGLEAARNRLLFPLQGRIRRSSAGDRPDRRRRRGGAARSGRRSRPPRTAHPAPPP